jgi:hypothetical protein
MRETTMKNSLRHTGALCALLATAAASAGTIDIYTPEGANLAMRKIQCSLKDGEAVTYYWHGEAYSRVPGERDRKLFKVEGMNVRQCVTVNDPQRGKGWRLLTRELLIYFDPKSGEVLKTWDNPWTGKTVNVIQTANDPVNQEPSFAKRRDGSNAEWPGSVNGNMWWMTLTIPLFYNNPLQGGYQDYVGGKYHATEMFNFMGDLDDLTNDEKPSAETRVGWARVSGWLPWMEMGDRVGAIYFHTAGRKLANFDDMSESLKAVIAKDYQAWRKPPPADDTRPNETSWTYFRDKVPAKTGK